MTLSLPDSRYTCRQGVSRELLSLARVLILDHSGDLRAAGQSSPKCVWFRESWERLKIIYRRGLKY